MNIDIDLSTVKVPDYGMYTDLGNAAVHAVVVAAKVKQLTWAQTVRALRALSDNDEFGEATDTAVREYVYHALGYQDESFYV
jgi:hypothetical protein